MSLYKIADFIIDFQNKYSFIEKLCSGYEYEGDSAADYTVTVSDEDIAKERTISESNPSNGYLESICAYRKLCLGLPLSDAMLLHGSVIAVQDRGIVFLALSGVGKSTHTALWKKLNGDEVTVINGDKPIIRFFDGVPYAYGTPWAGKENWNTNTRVRLTDLCFIERDERNSTFTADKSDCVSALLQQILLPSDPVAMLKTLQLADALSKQCRFWKIRCNMEDEAAVAAKKAIFSL